MHVANITIVETSQQSTSKTNESKQTAAAEVRRPSITNFGKPEIITKVANVPLTCHLATMPPCHIAPLTGLLLCEWAFSPCNRLHCNYNYNSNNIRTDTPILASVKPFDFCFCTVSASNNKPLMSCTPFPFHLFSTTNLLCSYTSLWKCVCECAFYMRLTVALLPHRCGKWTANKNRSQPTTAKRTKLAATRLPTNPHRPG